jgi:hypothetical protein
MEENGTLDRLSSELPMDERISLLEKLRGQSVTTEEPLYGDDILHSRAEDIETRYARLPWYVRLLFFILSIFMNKTSVKLFEDRELAKTGRQIDAITPGLFDYVNSLLLPDFHKELVLLKEGARFFYTALDVGVNRDRGAFYAFLGSLEMGEIHTTLVNGTDPVLLAGQYPETSEADLRHRALDMLDTAILTITEEQRAALYQNARSLQCLMELAGFLFDRLIMAFTLDPARSGKVCAGHVIKDRLLVLNTVLFSLKEPPSMALLESLMVFMLQAQPGGDMDGEIQKLLARAKASLEAIRGFNRRVPLTMILRCITRNTALMPAEISGGEDWFLMYREYWKRHIEAQFTTFIEERRQRELLDSFSSLFGDRELTILGYAASETDPDGFPVNGSFSLAFLLTFASTVLVLHINRVLNPILVDGEFYRQENQIEFSGV